MTRRRFPVPTGHVRLPLTEADELTIHAFRNFLSWHVDPLDREHAKHVPPAWWAYVLGHTRWCPPNGEM